MAGSALPSVIYWRYGGPVFILEEQRVSVAVVATSDTQKAACCHGRGFANSSTNTDWLALDVWTLDVICFSIGLDGPRHMCAPHQGARKSQAKYLKITEHTKHTPVDPGRTLL